jgi:hypothetical protein
VLWCSQAALALCWNIANRNLDCFNLSTVSTVLSDSAVYIHFTTLPLLLLHNPTDREEMSTSIPVSLNRFGHALSEEHWKRFDRFDRGSKHVTGVVNCTDDRTAREVQGTAVWSPDEQGRVVLRMTSAQTPSFNSVVLFEGMALKQLMETQNIEERAEQQGTLSHKDQQLHMRVVNGVLRVWDTLSVTSEGEPVIWVETKVPAILPFLDDSVLGKLKDEAEG